MSWGTLSRDVCQSCVVCATFCVFFLNVLLLPFTNFKSQINQSQKDALGKGNERTMISDLEILAQKWLKIARRKG